MIARDPVKTAEISANKKQYLTSGRQNLHKNQVFRYFVAKIRHTAP